jgi:hypothetical protein
MTTTVSAYRGDDVPITVTISETVAGVTTPFDLTGATLTSSMGSWTGTPVVIDAPTGVCEIQIPHATTELLSPGDYPIDVQVLKAGIRRTATVFAIRFLADVTLT